jgi:hypothetical protein
MHVEPGDRMTMPTFGIHPRYPMSPGHGRGPRPATVVAALLAPLLVAGCWALPGPPAPGATFDPAEVAWAGARGGNTLRGSALLRPAGGETRTCAGAQVALLPDSAYTRDRVRRLFGALDRGANDLAPGAMRRIEAADPAFARAVRTTTCDIHGRFGFAGLPDGTWYVTTSVAWRTRGNDPASQAGSALMQRVALSGGGVRQVQLGAGLPD